MTRDSNDTKANGLRDEPQPKSDIETEEWLEVRRDRLSRERRRNVIILASVAIVALILLSVLIWRWRNSATATEEAVVPVVSVRVTKVDRETIAAPVSAVGTIFPREQATVAAKISAQIKQMSQLKNKLVRAGDVLTRF